MFLFVRLFVVVVFFFFFFASRLPLFYMTNCEFCSLISYLSLLSERGVAPGEGDSNIKKVGVLVVSLRGVNFRFWSRLGFRGKITNIFSLQGLA